jgi:N-acetylgalactosamine-N,N'-diacetylbacillosaminyl-diphospho-undecaprenol 4-alpha-N-acetylgalactosaminyltransferase
VQNKKLSILIYSLAFGGAERVVSILLKELQHKFNITLVLMNDIILYDIPKNLKIIYLEKSQPSEIGILKLLKLPLLGLRYTKLCKENNIDISLSFMNRPNYINNISKILGNKSKIIINERAMPSLQHKSGVKGFINRVLIKKLYSKSNIIMANSIGNSLDLVNNFNAGNVITINNPFDIKNINKLSKEYAEVDKNNFTFITIGRLDNGKNHQLIISAMKGIDAKLYIIGNGELREKLEKQIKDLRLINKVFLLGHQKNPYKYLSKVDCFVFSSNNEGFPNVLVEALACGLPVISTDCQSGPREILAPMSEMGFKLSNDIELSEYGILFPTNNKNYLEQAMKIIINNSILRDNYINKSIQRANDFNLENIIKKYKDVICVE